MELTDLRKQLPNAAARTLFDMQMLMLSDDEKLAIAEDLTNAQLALESGDEATAVAIAEKYGYADQVREMIGVVKQHANSQSS